MEGKGERPDDAPTLHPAEPAPASGIGAAEALREPQLPAAVEAREDGIEAKGAARDATSAAAPATPGNAPERRSSSVLPRLDALTIDSDYTPFMQAGVDENVKRSALKKLFSDPRFNVMDGLDVYIDDYSKPDPISPDIVRTLVQARYIFNPPPTRVNEHGYVEDVPATSATAAEEKETESAGANASSDARSTSIAGGSSVEAEGPAIAVERAGEADLPAIVATTADRECATVASNENARSHEASHTRERVPGAQPRDDEPR